MRHILPLAALLPLVACHPAKPPVVAPPAAPGAPLPAEAKGVGGGCQSFAASLYAQAAAKQPGQNICLSPWSAFVALSMLAEGARGDTAAEFDQVLHASRDPKTGLAAHHANLRALTDSLRTSAGATGGQAEAIRKELAWQEDELARLKRGASEWKDVEKQKPVVARINALRTELNRFEFNSVNALFAEKTWPFVPAFLKAANTAYGTGAAEAMDFKNDPETARQRINAWGARQTHDRIKAVLPAKSVTPDTRLVLANAVYFKGEWHTPFEERHTTTQPFHNQDGTKTPVPLMTDNGLWRYAAATRDGGLHPIPKEVPADDQKAGYPKGGFHLIELPYKGDRLTMVFMAPVEGHDLAVIESKLTPELLALWLGDLQPRWSTVYIPRFKLEGATQSLKETLQGMGLKLAFADRQADFSGLSEVAKRSGNSDDNLSLSDAYQQTFLEVNEKGTEAAAVTVLPMPKPACAPPRMMPFHPVFRADRPFLYLLRDRDSGAILFMGRVLKQ